MGYIKIVFTVIFIKKKFIIQHIYIDIYKYYVKESSNKINILVY